MNIIRMQFKLNSIQIYVCFTNFSPTVVAHRCAAVDALAVLDLGNQSTSTAVARTCAMRIGIGVELLSLALAMAI